MSEIITLKVSELKDNPSQPTDRTTDTALRQLLETIVESKYIAPLQIIRWHGEYIVCDGHRRLSVARKLERETVDCQLLPEEKGRTPGVWFLMLNKPTRPIKGNNWFNAWATTKPTRDRPKTLKQIPTRTRAEIEDMIKLFGEDRAVELGTPGTQAPGICKYIREATSALSHFDLGAKTPAQQRIVAEWLLKHRQSNAIRRHLRDRRRNDPAVIKKLQSHIQMDTPLEDADGRKRRVRV